MSGHAVSCGQDGRIGGRRGGSYGARGGSRTGGKVGLFHGGMPHTSVTPSTADDRQHEEGDTITHDCDKPGEH